MIVDVYLPKYFTSYVQNEQYKKKKTIFKGKKDVFYLFFQVLSFSSSFLYILNFLNI